MFLLPLGLTEVCSVKIATTGLIVTLMVPKHFPTLGISQQLLLLYLFNEFACY